MVISLCLMLVVDSINSIPLEDNTGIIRPKAWYTKGAFNLVQEV